MANLFAHPVRAAIVEAPLDGRAASAGSLARHAHASPSATSAHLRRIERDGVVICEPDGRLRLIKREKQWAAGLRPPQRDQLIRLLGALEGHLRSLDVELDTRATVARSTR